MEFAKIEAAPAEATADAPWDDAAEVRQDLDRIFAAPGVAPTAGRVRVAFVERERAGRGFFGRVTVRDAAVAALAVVLGGVAGASLAPHPTLKREPGTAPAGETGVARGDSASASPPLLAFSALDAPPRPSEPSSQPPPEPRPAALLRGSQTAGDRLKPVAVAGRTTTGATLRGVRPPPLPAEPAEESAGVPAARSCADMPTLADEMVCDHAGLAAAEVELNDAYNAALAAAERPRALLREQVDWLDARDVAARRSERALEQLYRRRTQELWRRAEEPADADAGTFSWRDERR